MAEAFGPLERLVTRFSGGRHRYGDCVSIADVCLVPQVYNARRFNVDITPYLTVVRIADTLRADPAFVRAAPELQPDAQ